MPDLCVFWRGLGGTEFWFVCRVIRDSSKSSKDGAALPFPLVIIDEANKLERWDPGSPEALRTLLDFFVLVTKQENAAHVVLATSDNFLPSWLEKSARCMFKCHSARVADAYW